MLGHQTFGQQTIWAAEHNPNPINPDTDPNPNLTLLMPKRPYTQCRANRNKCEFSPFLINYLSTVTTAATTACFSTLTTVTYLSNHTDHSLNENPKSEVLLSPILS